MVYLAKGGTWLSMRTAVGTVMGLTSTVVLANLLDPQLYGKYQYVMAIAGIFWAFTLSGLGTSVTRDVARGFEGTYRRSIREQFVWSVGVGAVIGISSLYYLIQGNTILGFSLGAVAVTTPFLKSLTLWGAYLAGKKFFRSRAIAGIIFDVFSTLSLLGAVIVYPKQLPIIIGIFLTSQVLLHLGITLFFITKQKPETREDESSRRYGYHLSLMEVPAIIANRIDKVLIFQFVDPVSVAVYGIAQTGTTQLLLVTKWIRTLVAPKFSARSLSDLKKSLFQKVLILAAAMGGLVTIYILVAPFLFDLLFPNYSRAVPVTQILALLAVFSAATLYKEALISQQKTKLLYIFKIIVPALEIAALFFATIAYGLWGVVIAKLIARAISSIFLGTLFSRAT